MTAENWVGTDSAKHSDACASKAVSGCGVVWVSESMGEYGWMGVEWV
jgi:hypothetical protein